MALESSNVLRNSCYNLQSYLSKRFRKKIILPDGIPTTSCEYNRLIESRLIFPPQLMRVTNDPEKQRRTEEMMSLSIISSSLLKIIESPDFSFEQNPVIVKKKNIRELMNVVLVFSKLDIWSKRSSIYAYLVSQFLVKDLPEVPEFPRINAYTFNRNTKTALVQVLDQLLHLGYISKNMSEHLVEYERLSRNRYDFIPHPAQRHLEYFAQYGINPYRMLDSASLSIFLENYFQHEDPERKINDPEQLAYGPEIVKGISGRVFRHFAF